MSIFDKIPTGVVRIGGDVIRDAIFGGKRQSYTNTRNSQQDEFLTFSSFLTDLRVRGVSKNNRHLVRMYVPKIFSSIKLQELTGISDTFKKMFSSPTQLLELMSKSCEGASFPGFQMQMAEQRFQNHTAKFAYLKNFNDINLVFRCDNEFFEKKFFDVWSMLMIDPYSGFISYKEDISTTIEILQFDEEQKKIYLCRLINAMPTSINDLDSSWSGSADYHRLSVQLTYDKIEIEAITNPFYVNQNVVSATGTRPQSLFDRITSELFDVGKNIVITKVAKKSPVGTIPGIGSGSSILGRI